MMRLLDLVGYSFAIAYATWLFYLAAMTLIRARDDKRISKVALWLAYPVIGVGLLLDFTLNITVCTLLFVEWPREFLLTKRLSRLIKTDYEWRGDLAEWICTTLLDSFDPGGRHCAARAPAIVEEPQ